MYYTILPCCTNYKDMLNNALNGKSMYTPERSQTKCEIAFVTGYAAGLQRKACFLGLVRQMNNIH